MNHGELFRPAGVIRLDIAEATTVDEQGMKRDKFVELLDDHGNRIILSAELAIAICHNILKQLKQ